MQYQINVTIIKTATKNLIISRYLGSQGRGSPLLLGRSVAPTHCGGRGAGRRRGRGGGGGGGRATRSSSSSQSREVLLVGRPGSATHRKALGVVCARAGAGGLLGTTVLALHLLLFRLLYHVLHLERGVGEGRGEGEEGRGGGEGGEGVYI